MNQQTVPCRQSELQPFFFQRRHFFNSNPLMKILGGILLTAMVACSAYAQKPVLHLPMNKGKIMAVSDGGTLKKQGKSVFSEGQKGEGLVIDSKGDLTSELVITGNNLMTLKEGTISFWFKPLAALQKRRYKIISLRSSKDTNENIDLFIHESGAMMIQSTGGKNSAHFDFKWWKKPTWQAGKWYHISVTWKTDKTVSWYVNGKKISDSIKALIGGESPINKIIIGDRKDSISAVMDEVMVFDKVLTKDQIKKLEAEKKATNTSKSKDKTTAAGNWIKNPGFENPKSKYWRVNNWAKNKIDCGLDQNNPHSGKNCMRLSLTENTGHAMNLQFVSPKLPLKSGLGMELKLWIRGIPNSGEVAIRLRKTGKPYTTYWVSKIQASSNWQEHTFNFVISKKVDLKNTSLYVELNSLTTIWLDDVSLKTLPVQAGGKALRGNLIKNGSFETGRTHWFARFRENGGYRYSDIASENSIHSNIRSVADNNAPHGKKALHFQIKKNSDGMLCSTYFKMRYAHPVTLSFFLRTSKPGLPLNVSINGGKTPNVVPVVTRSIKTKGTDWEKVDISFTPSLVASHLYILNFNTITPGEYWLDAITVNEGKEKHFYAPNPMNIGWEPVLADMDHQANIFYKGEPVQFKILAEGKEGTKKVSLSGRILDAWNREIKKINLTIPLDKDCKGEKIITCPSNIYGGFLVELHQSGKKKNEVPDCDFFYNIAPKLEDPKNIKDSFFGGHVQLTPYNLHIAKMIGFRWVRLHPPLTTKWIVTEPEKGIFNHQKAGVARAHKMGFNILGSLASVPSFYADLPPGEKSSVWWSYPPKDWNKWKEYVLRTMNEYKDYIDTWEIWNEPDIDFLKVKKGVTKEAVCLNMAKYTLETVKENNLNVYLVGYGMSNFKNPLTANILKAGVGNYLDAFSVHTYGGEFSPEEYPGNPSLIEFGKKVNSYSNHYGGKLAYWMSEGGINSHGGKSFLRSVRVPPSSSINMHTACNSLVRTIASLKASGCKKHFHYSTFAQPSGRRPDHDRYSSIINPDGTPDAGLTAHATCVLFLEGTQNLGLDIVAAKNNNMKAKVVIAHFAKNGKAIDVAWSRIPVKLGNVPGMTFAGRKVFDMMGNPVNITKDTLLTLDPIYLFE